MGIEWTKWSPAKDLALPLGIIEPETFTVEGLFDETSNEEIAAAFGVMAACRQHRFEVSAGFDRWSEFRDWLTTAPPLHLDTPGMLKNFAEKHLNARLRLDRLTCFPSPNVGIIFQDEFKALA